MRSMSTKLCAAAAAAALTLSIALTGCGGQTESADTQEATEEQEATEASATQNLEIPEEMEEAVSISKDLVSGGEVADEADFNALETAENDELDDIGSDDDFVEGLDSADKAPSGVVVLESGGTQMQVPVTWFVAQDDDGFVLQEPNGYASGCMCSAPKQKGMLYSVEAMAQSVPSYYQQRGLSNIQVLNYRTAYSANGTQCAAFVLFSGTYKGTTGIWYAEFVESKSYITSIEFYGTAEGFANAAEDIEAMADSICFSPGEAI